MRSTWRLSLWLLIQVVGLAAALGSAQAAAYRDELTFLGSVEVVGIRMEAFGLNVHVQDE